MTLLDVLIQGFEYDLWANRLWVQCLSKFKDAERARAILGHCVHAQETWYKRISGHEMPHIALEFHDRLAETSLAWVSLLRQANLDESIAYVNLKGEPFTNTIAQMARHVINHGTYHRGHLRGIAEADGLDDFPETDMIVYLRQLNSE